MRKKQCDLIVKGDLGRPREQKSPLLALSKVAMRQELRSNETDAKRQLQVEAFRGLPSKSLKTRKSRILALISSRQHRRLNLESDFAKHLSRAEMMKFRENSARISEEFGVPVAHPVQQ